MKLVASKNTGKWHLLKTDVHDELIFTKCGLSIKIKNVKYKNYDMKESSLELGASQCKCWKWCNESRNQVPNL